MNVVVVVVDDGTSLLTTTLFYTKLQLARRRRQKLPIHRLSQGQTLVSHLTLRHDCGLRRSVLQIELDTSVISTPSLRNHQTNVDTMESCKETTFRKVRGYPGARRLRTSFCTAEINPAVCSVSHNF